MLGMIGMLAPWGGLKRVFGLYPSMRAALVGITVAGVIGGLVDGVGLLVAGAAAATAVPVAALATLRVLDHADDRTVALAVSSVTQTTAATPPDPAARRRRRRCRRTSPTAVGAVRRAGRHLRLRPSRDPDRGTTALPSVA